VPVLHYHTFRISAALQSLGSLGDGATGVSHVSLDGPGGAAFQQEYEAYYGIPTVYRDAIYYDAAMSLMLAAMIASHDLAEPTAVTGAQIRDAMKLINDPAGTVIYPGAEEFAKAIDLVKAGKTINYEGGSGPMDYDPSGNVLGRLAQYRAENSEFIDVAKFDCVKDALCPQMPAGQ
jgi:branched-chain amino acid transport system substrate-binding protein